MSRAALSMAAFWRQRSRREQAYLAVMLVSVAVFAYAFLLVAPLRSLAGDAERRHGIALAEQARLTGMLAELAGRGKAPAALADIAALVQGAASAGVAVTPDAGSAPGRITLRFDAAAPEALFAWLEAVRENQGLRPIRASVRLGASGVDGEVTFATVAP